MSFKNLRSFLNHLEKNNDLHRISAEVDPILEITEIVHRVGAKKGPALLFENVKGSKFPVVVNVLATPRRLEWVLGRSPEQVGREIHQMVDSLMPPSPKNLWKNKSNLLRILAMKPNRVGRAPVFENKLNPMDLTQLPITQTWPEDAGRFFTFPLVLTKSPIDNRQNMGVYRMHLYGEHQTGMHWQIGKGGGFHYRQAESNGQPLPVSVVVGADPLVMLGAVMPLPEGVDEVAFAGFLRGQSTRVSRGIENPVDIPSEAEFILEGVVPPHERKREGPFGDHFGHYSHSADFPVFHVKQIYHRNNPIFPVSVVGKPPKEDQVMGDAIQEIFLPLLKIMHPEVVDMWAYQEAGFHNLLVASVKERFSKEALKTALWILGEGQLALTKSVILVDADVNPRDFTSVLKAIRRNFDPGEDFILLPGTSQDTLDFTSFRMNLGSKMVINATRNPSIEPPKPIGSGVSIDFGKISRISSQVQDIRYIENTLLVVQVIGNGRPILEKMISLEILKDVPLMAAVSPDVPLDHPTLLLWGLFTRFDCARDTFFKKVDLKGGHPIYQGPMAIDATWKNGYPKPVEMTPEIIEKVNRRWKEYGFN